MGGNGANRTVTGDISIPRYCIAYRQSVEKHLQREFPVAVGECSTPIGNQWKKHGHFYCQFIELIVVLNALRHQW